MRKFSYDAATGLAFMLSQLSAIETKMYEKKYKAITYNLIVPIKSDGGEFVTSITYFFMDGKAVAQFVGTKSLNVPISEIGTESVNVSVELGSTGYEYSDEELGQAMMLGRSLTADKANVARRACEEHLQAVAMLGDTAHGLPGFINNSNVTAASVIDPGSGSEWINKTPNQIIFDVNDFMGDIFVDTLQVERPTRLLLPTAQWNYIAGTPRSDNSDATILAWLVANSPYLSTVDDVIAVAELAGAGSGGSDRMMTYDFDVDKVVMHIPKPLVFTEPQRKGRGYEVPGTYKCGGVEFRYPGSARYADGI
jgi:hypothetical protein